jgi:hypothetical protein
MVARQAPVKLSGIDQCYRKPTPSFPSIISQPFFFMEFQLNPRYLKRTELHLSEPTPNLSILISWNRMWHTQKAGAQGICVSEDYNTGSQYEAVLYFLDIYKIQGYEPLYSASYALQISSRGQSSSLASES